MDKETREKYQKQYDNLSSKNYFDFGRFCEERDRLWCLANIYCAIATVKTANSTHTVACCVEYSAFNVWENDVIESEISSSFDCKVEVSNIKEVSHEEFSKFVGMSIADFGNKWNRYSRFVKIVSTDNEAEKRRKELADKLEEYELDHEDDEYFDFL
jgi:hypothetical protein